jgi:hypothetical protein
VRFNKAGRSPDALHEMHCSVLFDLLIVEIFSTARKLNALVRNHIDIALLDDVRQILTD